MEPNVEKPTISREIIVLGLLTLPLLVAVSAIEAADWVDGLPSLKGLTLVSVVLWALFIRRRLPWWVSLIVVLLVAPSVSFLLGAYTFAKSTGVVDLGGQVSTWVTAIGGTDGDEGETVMGVFLLMLTVLMSYSAVSLAYRRSLAILAAIPGLVVLLVVLSFLPSNYYWYFFAYFLAAAPAAAYPRGSLWVFGDRRTLWTSIVAGVALMGLTLVPVWLVPAPKEPVIPLTAQFDDSWYSFRENWAVLFQGVPNRNLVPSFSPPNNLPISEPIELSEEVIFEVKSTKPYRWRMRVYDTYTSTGWFSGGLAEDLPSGNVEAEGGAGGPLKDREDVGISIRLHHKTNTLVSVGEPLGSDILSQVEVSASPTFEINLDGLQSTYLPPELRTYQPKLILWADSEEFKQIQDDEQDRSNGSILEINPEHLPLFDDIEASGFQVVDAAWTISETLEGDPADPILTSLRLERTVPSQAAPVALKGVRTLVPPRQYETLGSISVAEPAVLITATQDYPQWVTDRYLQLPDTFSELVKELAADITEDDDNPYDMAESIRGYLIRLPYSLEVSLPPPGRDWVEHFLLFEKRGFCNNYATAMVTMLRSLGVPARLVVGFAPGIPNETNTLWKVQARQYHAWPEVYFPEYGWVEFEPTPSDVQPALEHLGITPLGLQPVVNTGTEPLCTDEFSAADCARFALDEEDDLERQFPGLGGGSSSGSASGLTEGTGFFSSSWLRLSLILGISLLLVIGGFFYIWRVLSNMGYATSTYAFMCYLGRLTGVGLRPHETPYEYSARLGSAMPNQASEISIVTQRYVGYLYGGEHRRVYSEEMWTVRAAWRTVRRVLLGRILQKLTFRTA